MVEAMYEKTPEFFMRYKKFRYIISYDVLHMDDDFATAINYAFGYHSEHHDLFCSVQEPHYHVLIEASGNEELLKVARRVPCL